MPAWFFRNPPQIRFSISVRIQLAKYVSLKVRMIRRRRDQERLTENIPLLEYLGHPFLVRPILHLPSAAQPVDYELAIAKQLDSAKAMHNTLPLDDLTHNMPWLFGRRWATLVCKLAWTVLPEALLKRTSLYTLVCCSDKVTQLLLPVLLCSTLLPEVAKDMYEYAFPLQPSTWAVVPPVECLVHRVHGQAHSLP